MTDEPAAYLKEWVTPDGAERVRVDLRSELDAWMVMTGLDVKVTPLYVSPASEIERLTEGAGDWLTIEAERVLYLDDGREKVLCDRLSSPVTLVIKRASSVDRGRADLPRLEEVARIIERHVHAQGAAIQTVVGIGEAAKSILTLIEKGEARS